MKTVEILGANRFESYTKTRDGSRAIIIQDGKILLSHEIISGWWLIPGGGMEEGETPKDCVVREVEEETGLIVRPTEQFLILHEYYEEYRYTSYYFVCEVTGVGHMNLTDEEKRRGLKPEWIPLQDAIEMFSKHESYADVNEEKRGSYQREYMALKEYMNKDNYICKIPTIEEIEQKWDYEIALHSEKDNWIIWKAEAIAHYKEGSSIPYYGILDGKIICEATAIVDQSTENEKTVELNAFRTIKEFRGQGYFSRLKDFMLEDLKQKGYTRAIVGVEPCEEINKQIYHHWGFIEYITTGTETYPDGTVIDVEYYGKDI